MREALKAAFTADDAAAVRELLQAHPELRALLNEPVDEFGGPPLLHVRSVEMLDVCLEAGADINSRSNWEPGGFGLLEMAPREVAMHAIERGAELTVHAGARLGLTDELREMLQIDPALVHARGGDGQTPLHFASSIEVAELLLASGAQIDARDIDHSSTPAQYMLDNRSEVARYLIERGCETDILMGAALGDGQLVQKHLDADPGSIRMRVSDEWFPMIGGGTGGTIYQWNLGWYVSSVQVAKSKGHAELFESLTERCPTDENLLNYCWLHDVAAVTELVEKAPDVIASMPLASRRHLAHACRNNDTEAAILMLAAGLPIDATSQHQASGLHWAAWHGNVQLVKLLLEHHASLNDAANEFKSTPLGWAKHGSENGWNRAQGNYPATIEALLAAASR